MNRELVHILLVEDDDIDAELVLRAYRRHRLENPFTIVRDGVEALEVLRGSTRTERLPRPYLI
jgi:CheY-like chemotaxis protein